MEATNKWHERFQRVNYSKIYVILARENGISIVEKSRLDKLVSGNKIKKYIVLAKEDCNNYADVRINKWNDKKNLFAKDFLHKHMFEKYFDFISFLND